MDDSCRLLLDITIYQESYTKKNERNAEELSHVQNHILLEANLRFLDELDEETHAEASDEEGADEEASVELVQTESVHKNLEYTEKEIAQSLVKLCRMLRFRLAAELENEAPWEICDIAIYL
jgi:hypothetical protein